MCFSCVLSEPERRAVLRQAADARGVFLSDEVMDFMLTRFSRDLGSLMELLDLMDGYALQTKRAITIPLIKSMMDNTIIDHRPKLTLFDLDHTLLPIDSDYAWGVFTTPSAGPIRWNSTGATMHFMPITRPARSIFMSTCALPPRPFVRQGAAKSQAAHASS